MQAAALLKLGLAILPMVQTGITEFVVWLESLRATLQQSGEWTEEEDLAFEAEIYSHTNDPAYAPDPPQPPTP